MSSKLKPAKAELIAIYRLEFYKKQRNWKFCKDVCKTDVKPEAKHDPEPPAEAVEPPVIKHKPLLNETYNIEEPLLDAGDGNDSALNHAFVETDSDQVPPTTPPDPDTANVWPDLASTPELLKEAETWTSGDAMWERAEQAWQNFEQEWGGQQYYASQPDECASWHYDGGWPAAPTETPLGWEGCSWRPMALAEELVQEVDCSTYTYEELASSSLESAFLRGAALAPHSSEIDLRQTEIEELPASPVSCLSSKQIAEQVTHHARLLRDLIQEVRVRSMEHQRPLSSMSCDRRDLYLSREELPTRDIDPTIHTHTNTRYNLTYDPTYTVNDQFITGSINTIANFTKPNLLNQKVNNIPFYNNQITNFSNETVGQKNTAFGDPFLAGSFKNRIEIGKGRGRLNKERVIGIGMGGRPYRL